MHAAPHAVASKSPAQREPHRWYPVVHAKSHLSPSHEACVAPVGTGHGRHEVPHAFTSINDGQRLPQTCWPVGHPPAQGVPMSMQAPWQSCLPAGHAPPQDFPSQTAVPSAGTSHGVQDVPQVFVSASDTHPPGHVCFPAGHSGIGGAVWASTPN